MKKTIKSRKRRSQRDYNLGFKLAVVSQVEKDEMAYKQAQKIYSIQGRSTVFGCTDELKCGAHVQKPIVMIEIGM